MRLRMHKLCVGKGRQYCAIVATERVGCVLYRAQVITNLGRAVATSQAEVHVIIVQLSLVVLLMRVQMLTFYYM